MSPASGGPSSSPITVAGGYGATYLIVGRLDFNTTSGTTNRIWVNPDLALGTPSDASSVSIGIDATVSKTARPSLVGRMFSAGTGGTAATILTYDEVRIGNSFSQVLPTVGQFSVSPASAIQNQELTFNWSAIPASATSITLNPGAVDLLPLTTGGAGTKPLPAPATNTTYSLTYSDGVASETLEVAFTAIAPSFTMPASGYLGDMLTLNWQVPVGSTAVTLTPGSVDLTLDTSTTDGKGMLSISTPSATTTYTLSYTFDSVVSTIDKTFTLLPSFVSVTPDQAIVQVSPLAIQWRIDPAFSVDSVSTDVFLDIGPAGGPYVETLVSTNPSTGAGTYNHTPVKGDAEYRIRYYLGGVPQVLTDTVAIYPKVFNLGTPVNNTKPVQTNLQPMFDGVTAYSDRGHVWAAVPTILQGAQFAKMGQDDKNTATLQIPFTAVADGTFFLLIDNRMGDDVGGNNPAAGTDNPPTLGNGVMDWVLTSGFVDSGVDVGLDESPSGATSIDQSYSVYFRQVSAGETFTFLQQANTNLRNMYGIAAVSPQVVPIAFVVTAPVITKGASTTLQWTVTPGSTVSINQSVGDVTASTDPLTGVGSTSISPTATTAYTLTYDPPGAATPAVNLGPVTVTVNDFTATPATINGGADVTVTWQVPVGATAVTISNGVGDVSLDTDANGAGTKVITPTVSGSYTLTYLAAGATNPTTVATLPVTVLSFTSWISGNFGGNTVPVGQRGPNDDPDSDGIDNLVEYAILGGDPTRSTVSPAIISGTLVTFNKNPDAVGISYALEKSGDLAIWDPATTTANDANIITYTLAPPSPASEFVRLKVTQP